MSLSFLTDFWLVLPFVFTTSGSMRPLQSTEFAQVMWLLQALVLAPLVHPYQPLPEGILCVPKQYQKHKGYTRRQARTVEVQGTIAVQQPCS